jgi:diguanylate cyclase
MAWDSMTYLLAEIGLPIFIIGVTAGVLPVILGVMIGAWMATRQRVVDNSDHLESTRAKQVVGDLLQWASTFAGDVSEYRTQMEAISNQLGEQAADVPGLSADPATLGPVDLLTTMAQANEKLQSRLDSAEVTLAEQAEELTSYLSQARTDALTDMPNRRAFDDELARRHAEFLRKGDPLSVLLIDIDHFKQFNDEHGHLAGDFVLQGVGGVLKDSLRGMDTVARFGGEELAMVLPDTNVRDAFLPAERSRKSVENGEFEYEGKILSVTVSCGLAQAMPDEPLSGLLKRADEALYAAKAGGRNRGYYHDGQSCRSIVGDVVGKGNTKRFTESRSASATGDLQQACQQLRERLFERLGNAS